MKLGEVLEGKKTIAFFILTLVIALAGLFGFAEYQPTPEQAEGILAIVSLVGIILRAVTKTPLFKKE